MMSLKTGYLVMYNAMSFLLWTYLTAETVSSAASLYSQSRLSALYIFLSPLLAITQSLAILEVLHAASGLIRASPLTTALQIGGKNLVVWTVMLRFPDIMKTEQGMLGFLGCVMTWGCSEMIRYGFFVVQLTRSEMPRWLKWLRYSAFVILYPPGLLSEAWLVYLSFAQATGLSSAYRGYLLAGLLSYMPAGYFLYTHMLAQRRRVLKDPSQKR
ncbi:protein tyrosine phosphatase [Pseudomassariella vexata]|uniref:Very-long-chain (3R)-3-hydroxyacyl-CoA dehydratase n=1 Tax=Pseudomassariella vexata TaxID=1141098 RepID=A0A1Y2D6G3_9PEZI|nr:protein tyrosine phosphatase [Pseudomassariella vexata]ORY54734.1 protein tyrosine phosphatase [Pseudomassariella vexata]